MDKKPLAKSPSNEFDDVPLLSPEEAGNAGPSATSEFDDVELLPADKGEDYASLQKREEDRSWFNRPGLIAQPVSDTDVANIAKQFGVSEQELKEKSPWVGARVASQQNETGPEVKRALGILGNIAALGTGVPAKLYKGQQEPNMEQALDAVQRLADNRASYLQKGAELAAPGAVIKSVPKLAALGAVSGYSQADKGKELEGAAIGAAAVPALSKAAPYVLKAFPSVVRGVALKITGRSGTEEAAKIEKALEDSAVDIEEVIYQAREKIKPVLGDITQAVVYNKELTDDQAKAIAETFVGADAIQARMKLASEATTQNEQIKTALDELSVKAADLEERMGSVGRVRTESSMMASIKAAQQKAANLAQKMETTPPDSPKYDTLAAEYMNTAAKLDDEINEYTESSSVRDYLSSLTRQLDTVKAEKKILVEQLLPGAESQAAVYQKAAKDYLDQKRKDLAAKLSGTPASSLEADDAAAIIAKAAEGGEGVVRLAKQFENSFDVDAATKYVQSVGQIGGRTGFLNRAIDVVSDAQFVFKDIDNRFGTWTNQALDRMSRGINKMGGIALRAQKELTELADSSTTAVDKVITGTDKVYNAMVEGNLDTLTGQEKKVAEGFRKFFANWRSEGNAPIDGVPDALPLAIKERANYVPSMIMSPRDLRVRAIQEKDKILSELGVKSFSDLDPNLFKLPQDKMPKPLQNAIRSVSLFSKEPPTSGALLDSAWTSTFSSKSRNPVMETAANAAFEADGGTPKWMLEKDLYKLAMRWVQNTFRHRLLGDSIQELRVQAGLLRDLGADNEALYINNLIQDITGSRTRTLASWLKDVALRTDVAVEKMVYEGKISEDTAKAARALPVVMNDLSGLIYQNVLGLSSKAAIANMTQTINKVWPEIGASPYGTSLVARGATNGLINRQRYKQELLNSGAIPDQIVRSAGRGTSEAGLERTKAYNAVRKTTESMGNVALYGFQYMEESNRAISKGIANQMTNDLLNGGMSAQKGAQSVLERFPNAIQKAVMRAGQDPKAIEDILTTHLINTTQYQYNPAVAAEWTRALGPMFSRFSKWPAATLGEIAYEYRTRGLSKGTLRVLEKAAAPYLLWSAIDYLSGMSNPDDMSDRQKALFGQGGLRGTSPIPGTINYFVDRKTISAPAVDLLWKNGILPQVRAKNSRDRAEEAENLAARTYSTFGLGGGYVRFLADDLPTIITGDRPRGDNLFERAETTVNRLKRKMEDN